MLSLYEILKASKTGIAPDMWTALAGMNWGGAGSGAEVKELTGIPPLSFRADGTLLLDYLISGNMEQSTTPTPTTPIQPQECGERTANLWDEDYTGINTNAIYRPLFVGDGEFTLSTNFKPIGGITDIFLLSGNVSSGINSSTNGAYEGKNITAQSVNGYITIAYRANARTSSGSLPYCKTMLNTGSTALPYEPYGYKIPISSASTTTPVYLGEVESTRQIRELILDGTENYSFDSERSQVTFTVVNGQRCIPYCSHYIGKLVNSWSELGNGYIAFHPTNSAIIRICDTTITSVADFKAYLAAQYAAGTPVTVWYVLAEPTTGIVNEPLRKIGDYADTLSMEQAGVSIPTNNGSTTIDVLTELKPSEVYIKYKGV